MGFSSQDDLISKITVSGNYNRNENSKSTSPAHTAGGWHMLVGNAGTPNAGTFPGTDLTWVTCTESTGDGTTVIGMQHGGNVSTMTKHIVNIGASIVAAAGAPWQLKLVDLQGYWRFSGTNVTGTGARSLLGTPTLRYANGVGLEACFVVQTAPTAGGPTLSASAYTNTTGTTTRAFQGTPSFGAAADAYATRVPHSGVAAARYGPFLPKQGGDLGIANITSVTLSGGTAYTGSGVLALCLVKPLADISIPLSGMWSERDLVNQLPSLPQVKDGACLVWMLFSAGATTNLSPLNAAIDFAWG